ncbi:Bro-N domain-containing protein [Variovorax sp. RTB1]|uniref:BRO-N domain-containing protein n=1 Tax=Variovorax sp. RTB1 TaxID=3048631 RepID=UPI002B22B032|nr:Bro-N domain-containing protein [Variovorax sp. RTB1]MEB0114786.1 Bro-N domain-containing protein [Variovorax sp. RTB1]
MNIIPFNFNSEAVRSIVIAGEPWFVAADLAAVLGYSETAAATRTVDDEDKGLQTVQTLGGPQSVSIVNEAGLYCLILGSRLPAAKAFKRWVTSEVLPSIRKTGAFSVTAPHEAALAALRHVHSEADREVEHRTQHCYHRPGNARATERINAVIADVAAKRGLGVDAVTLGFRQSIEHVMAETYGDTVAQARIERKRLELAPPPKRRPKVATRRRYIA